MRRLITLILALLLLSCTAVSAGAVTGITEISEFATVDKEGSCTVSITATLRIEQAMDKMVFPIPGDATDVRLNNDRVTAEKSGTVRNVDLSSLIRNYVGDALTFTIQYSLYDVIVTTEAGTLEMQLPLLSGFIYPIEKMKFSVTLPGNPDALPGFVSGYHKARIEEYLVYTVEGTAITGNTVQALKDQETLMMRLPVKEEMFPRTLTHTHDYGWGLTAMGICLAVALLYWFVAMANRPGFARTLPEPPQGSNAGNLGCIMAGTGLNLTMMVLSWAQLGYILIHIKGNRVILYRQMDMGNERSESEVRWFRKLFGKKDRVDTTQFRYANLCRMAANSRGGIEGMFKRWNGNPKVFRGIAALTGMFGGAALAVALAEGAALQGFLLVVLSGAGLLTGWQIQNFGAGFLLRDRRLWQALISCGVWLLLGILGNAFDVALLMVSGLLISGLLLAWGGRRTPQGRLAQMQVRGFGRYLQRVKNGELMRMCRNDPEYFFRMVPYAMALGRERRFAKQFGQLRLERCPYLTTGMDGHMTALQWAVLMRKAVHLMEGRSRQLPMEKLIRTVRGLTQG